MRPVLLLAPDRDGVPVRLRWQVELCSAGAVEPDAGYGSVIVLNDGRAGTVERLRQALALRDRSHELQIGVLTWLAAQPGPALALAAPGLPAVLGALGPELKVEIKDRILSVEYQA